MPANLPAGVDEAMVERMARAIFESEMRWLPILDHQFAENKKMYLASARAALTAELGDTHCVVSAEAIKQARWMANICFNLKQTNALDARTRKSLEECQVAFDSAIASSGGK